MYNAGKVEALANSKTETNVFSWEPQQTKPRVIYFSPLFFFFSFVTFSRDKWPHRSSYGAPSLPALVLLFLFVLFRTATPASSREGERRSPGHSHTRRHTEKPLTRTAAVLKGTPDMRQNATVSREPSKLNKKKQK